MYHHSQFFFSVSLLSCLEVVELEFSSPLSCCPSASVGRLQTPLPANELPDAWSSNRRTILGCVVFGGGFGAFRDCLASSCPFQS